MNTHIFKQGLIAVLLCGLVSTAFAQTSSLSGLETGRSKLEQLLTSEREQLPIGKPFFEGPVDPETFELGPGDVLDIFLWRPIVTRLPTRVNAEGEAVIPTVGPVKVTGMTLAKAKQAIIASVRQRFSDAELTVSLNDVREFRVHVSGAVNKPGSYLVPATARVADAIFLAGGLRHRQRAEWDATWVPVASQRRIQVFAAGNPQDSRRADLALFKKAGNLTANPYLHDGDVVWVPLKEKGPSEVGVFGGVFSPGLFEYVPGDHISDLIELAEGTRRTAKIQEAYLVRSNGERISISLNTEVKPGDRLYVPMEYVSQRFGTVTLKGEFVQPGSYPIEIGKTTLREVLAEAGGPLPDAAINSARLIRAPDYEFRDPEKARLLRKRQLGNVLDKGWLDRILTAAYERWPGTTVVLDLSRLLKDDNPGEDIILCDGDVLEIPKQPLGIRMLGYVNQSGETAYHPGWKLKDYLQAVGGVNRGGWKSRAQIVKASTGSVLLYSSRVSLDPGDIVFVPAKPQPTTWAQIKDGIAIVAQLATIALIAWTVK